MMKFINLLLSVKSLEKNNMSIYNIITSTDESTVVAEYSPPYRAAAEYQSEADLEREFIRLLSGQGYEFLAVKNEAALRRRWQPHSQKTRHL